MSRQNATNTYSYSKYIVDNITLGCYTTIQSAINDAMAAGGGLILIRSGTYTEDLTLYTNVDLEGTGNKSVTIEGTHTPPLLGQISFENLLFLDPTAILSSAAAGSSLIFFHNCSFIVANGFIADLPNWTSFISFDSCDTDSTEDGIVNFTSTAELYIINSQLGAGTTQTTLANDLVSIQQSSITCPTFFTGAETGTFDEDIFYNKMILADNIVSTINNCIFNTGANRPLDASSAGLTSLSNVTFNSSALTVVIGTGTVQFGSVTYLDGKDIAPGITRDFTTRFETGELKLADATAGILHATAGVVSALADPLTVPHGGTGDATLTLHGILLGNAANAVQVTAEPANGQLPIGKTGDFPQLGYLTSTGGTLTITNGAGTINLEAGIASQINTGFASWGGAGAYYDDTTLGSFTILRPGTGYIKDVLISWAAPQTVAGLVSGVTYWIYIDSAGVIQKASTRTDALYTDQVVLFECLRDATLPANNQVTVKENHPYQFNVGVSNYLHNVVGSVIQDNGANITLNGTQKIQIDGADFVYDHGLNTTIPDSAGVGVSWKKYYTDAAGKWALQGTSDTFSGYWNDAGTPTLLGATRFGVYTLYVTKDNLNVTTPIYCAILDTSEYNNLSLANTAISNGTVAKATTELMDLELCQLGYIIFGQSTNAIVQVIIEKASLKSSTSTSGTNIASLVTTVTTNFDGILSAADTNVQVALETIDEFGKNLTDHAIVVGNGNGFPLGVIGVGSTGQLMTGVTGADPAFATSSNGNFTFTTASAGTDRSLSITNTDNTNTASHAHLQITTGGGSGGDPYTNWLVSGAGTFSAGIDNSASDIWRLTTGATPSAGINILGALGTQFDIFPTNNTITPTVNIATGTMDNQVGNTMVINIGTGAQTGGATYTSTKTISIGGLNANSNSAKTQTLNLCAGGMSNFSGIQIVNIGTGNTDGAQQMDVNIATGSVSYLGVVSKNVLIGTSAFTGKASQNLSLGYGTVNADGGAAAVTLTLNLGSEAISGTSPHREYVNVGTGTLNATNALKTISIGTGTNTAGTRSILIGETGAKIGFFGAVGTDPINIAANTTITTATAATDRRLTISNTDNTDATSHAHLQVTTGGASGGDPYVNFLVTGAGTYSIGIDNSDSDILKITTGGTPSAGSTLVRFTNSGNVYVDLGDLYVQRASIAGIVESIVSNTDNTDAGSDAGFYASAGGPFGGDAFTNYLISGAGTFSVGIDNSDSDKLKITSGTTPSAGTDILDITTTSMTLNVAAFNHSMTTAANPVYNTIINTDITLTDYSSAYMLIQTEGITFGDPYLRFNVHLGQDYSFGIDNTAADTLKITDDVDPSTGNILWSMTSAGESVMPLQPAFLAYQDASVLNVTGNGAVYTLGTTALTEVFDQGSDFNVNGTFTAPVTGRYSLTANITITGTTSATVFEINIITTKRTYYNYYYRSSANKDHSMQLTTLADMDSGDTATVTIMVDGEGGDTDDIKGGATLYTYFCGHLEC
jgi:hypothetical protein